MEACLKEVRLVPVQVHQDSRGSFREVYHRERMIEQTAQLFTPKQWNISTNTRRGAIRGIHIEPWDKYLHCIVGRVFAAVVDLRLDSATFGCYQAFILDQHGALYVPQGFGNSYQALEGNTIYGYLVSDHWRPDVVYPAVHYADPDIRICWPLDVGPDDVSEKDQKNPTLLQAFPAKFGPEHQK